MNFTRVNCQGINRLLSEAAQATSNRSLDKRRVQGLAHPETGDSMFRECPLAKGDESFCEAFSTEKATHSPIDANLIT